MDIYKDIANRTNGEIYIGVVGPVRTGKSTFIKRFMGATYNDPDVQRMLEMITYNVKKAKHIWCASEDSPCRKYLDGEMTRQELDDLYAQGPDQFICYECGMLNNWKASGGIVQTGNSLLRQNFQLFQIRADIGHFGKFHNHRSFVVWINRRCFYI